VTGDSPDAERNPAPPEGVEELGHMEWSGLSGPGGETESEEQNGDTRWRIFQALGLSLAFHGSLLAVAIFTSAMVFLPPNHKPMDAVFIIPVALPTPPKPQAPEAPSPPKVEQPKPKPKPVLVKKIEAAPTPAPVVETPPVAEPAPDTPMLPAIEGSRDGGTSSPDAVTSATSMVALPPVPAYIPSHKLTRLPAFLSKVDPVYPEGERFTGRDARVVVEILLGPEGTVDSVKIIKSGGAVFDAAVRKALEESRFSPGLMDDRPVAVRVQIPFVFKLK
jgi:protein TonB